MRAVLGILFILVVVAMFALGDKPDTASRELSDLKEDACYASRQYVKALHRSPSSVDFGLCSAASVSIDDQGRYVVSSHIVAQNALGQKQRQPYSVVLAYVANEKDWELVEVLRTP